MRYWRYLNDRYYFVITAIRPSTSIIPIHSNNSRICIKPPGQSSDSESQVVNLETGIIFKSVSAYPFAGHSPTQLASVSPDFLVPSRRHTCPIAADSLDGQPLSFPNPLLDCKSNETACVGWGTIAGPPPLRFLPWGYSQQREPGLISKVLTQPKDNSPDYLLPLDVSQATFRCS